MTDNAAALAAPPLSSMALHLGGLNPVQRQAVEALDGPVLVLAGAGTGKTRVLTARLVHLLATARAMPSHILAVTFTNKAANEMRQRVEHLLGRPVEGWWLGTFHSIGTRILRRHAEVAGLRPNFTILDADDQVRLLKQIMAAEQIDDKRWPARLLMGVIQRWKDRGSICTSVPRVVTRNASLGASARRWRAGVLPSATLSTHTAKLRIRPSVASHVAISGLDDNWRNISRTRESVRSRGGRSIGSTAGPRGARASGGADTAAGSGCRAGSSAGIRQYQTPAAARATTAATP